MGAEKTKKLGNITATSPMERAFSGLPFPTAFIRTGSFYENLVNAVSTAQHTGKYFSFQLVDFPFPTVGTVDIGNEVVELCSLTTANQMAAAISKVTESDVQAQIVPQHAWAQTLQQFGLQPGSTGPYEQMMESINNNWIAFGQPGAEAVSATQTPEEFFRSLLQ